MINNFSPGDHFFGTHIKVNFRDPPGISGGLGAKEAKIKVEKWRLPEDFHSGRYEHEILRKRTFWFDLPVSTKIFPWRYVLGGIPRF